MLLKMRFMILIMKHRDLFVSFFGAGTNLMRFHDILGGDVDDANNDVV